MKDITYYSYHGVKPIVSPSAYVHPRAVIIGNVIIEEDVYIGPCAVLRGDWGKIHIKKGANVQENCVIHVYPSIDVILEEGAHIGHGAILHSAKIGVNALIGMNSVIMDGAMISENCIVGAMSFVPTNFKCEKNQMIFGNPAKVIKEISKEMLEWKTEGTALYQELAREGKECLAPCVPLSVFEEQKPTKEIDYTIWKERR